MIFDHMGVPLAAKKEGMSYWPEFKVWFSDYEKHLFRIEWIFCESDSLLHELIQTKCHLAYNVTDLNQVVVGKRLLLKPVRWENFLLAFIEVEGVPIELIQNMVI